MQELLINNSASMKTVVETYIIEETQELIYDNEKLDQWNKRVQELGLTGQTKIKAKDKSPIPFLHMKSTLVNVFLQLCPRRGDIKDYDKTPDPACVGLAGKWIVYKKNYSHIAEVATETEALAFKSDPEYYNHYFEETAKYLIGRWADVKQSFEELTAKAKKLFIANRKVTIEKAIKDELRKLEDLEHEAAEQFGFDEAAPLVANLPF